MWGIMAEHLLTSSEPPIVSRIDRRASTRYPCNLSTSCRIAALVAGDPIPGRVRNISAGGISLVLGHPVDGGDEITVELRSNFRHFARAMLVRVAYCVEHPSGDWIVGAAFTQPMTEEEVKLLLI
jgi:hypothetical protein